MSDQYVQVPSGDAAGLMYSETDQDGRCTTLLDPAMKLSPGVYKLIFHTGPYFETQGVKTLYPFVEVCDSY